MWDRSPPSSQGRYGRLHRPRRCWSSPKKHQGRRKTGSLGVSLVKVHGEDRANRWRAQAPTTPSQRASLLLDEPRPRDQASRSLVRCKRPYSSGFQEKAGKVSACLTGQAAPRGNVTFEFRNQPFSNTHLQRERSASLPTVALSVAGSTKHHAPPPSDAPTSGAPEPRKSLVRVEPGEARRVPAGAPVGWKLCICHISAKIVSGYPWGFLASSAVRARSRVPETMISSTSCSSVFST